MYNDAKRIILRIIPKQGDKPIVRNVEFKLCIKKSELILLVFWNYYFIFVQEKFDIFLLDKMYQILIPNGNIFTYTCCL